MFSVQLGVQPCRGSTREGVHASPIYKTRSDTKVWKKRVRNRATKIGFDKKKSKLFFYVYDTTARLPSKGDVKSPPIPVSSHPVYDVGHAQIMPINLVDLVNRHIGLKTVSNQP